MTKALLRFHFKELRAQLSGERRAEAAESLKKAVLSSTEGPVLSFFSIGTEIDTSPLNQSLLSENRLALPKVVEGGIVPFAVESLDRLIPGPLGLKEPDPSRCRRLEINELGCILVPGLAFDEVGGRLGYGLGHFDRFLAQVLKNEALVKVLGIGFTEQLAGMSLPKEEHDIPIRSLLLV